MASQFIADWLAHKQAEDVVPERYTVQAWVVTILRVGLRLYPSYLPQHLTVRPGHLHPATQCNVLLSPPPATHQVFPDYTELLTGLDSEQRALDDFAIQRAYEIRRMLQDPSVTFRLTPSLQGMRDLFGLGAPWLGTTSSSSVLWSGYTGRSDDGTRGTVNNEDWCIAVALPEGAAGASASSAGSSSRRGFATTFRDSQPHRMVAEIAVQLPPLDGVPDGCTTVPPVLMPRATRARTRGSDRGTVPPIIARPAHLQHGYVSPLCYAPARQLGGSPFGPCGVHAVLQLCVVPGLQHRCSAAPACRGTPSASRHDHRRTARCCQHRGAVPTGRTTQGREQ